MFYYFIVILLMDSRLQVILISNQDFISLTMECVTFMLTVLIVVIVLIISVFIEKIYINMAFFIENKKIHFHKTYLDRVPKRYLPVYSGSARFTDIEVTLNVRRNTQGNKYYWIFVFLGRTFVFWTDSFDTNYVGEFNQVCYAYVSAFKAEVEKNSKVCNALIQKSFE